MSVRPLIFSLCFLFGCSTVDHQAVNQERETFAAQAVGIHFVSKLANRRPPGLSYSMDVIQGWRYENIELIMEEAKKSAERRGYSLTVRRFGDDYILKLDFPQHE